MKNKEQGSVNAVLLIIILILIAIIVYLLYKKGSTESVVVNEQQTQNDNQNTALPLDNTLITEGSDAYAREFPEQSLGTVQLTQKVDITGDDIPEVVLNTGNGGATTDAFSLFRFENNTLVFARSKEKTGEVRPITLLAGAGGAGRYGNSYELIPSEHAIYITSYSIYGVPEDYCTASAYQWNPQSKLFEYSASLSVAPQQKLQKTCNEVRAGLELQ